MGWNRPCNYLAIVALLLSAYILSGSTTLPGSAGAATKLEPHPAVQWAPQPRAKLPLSFEANQGQTDEQVDFLARGRGYTWFITPAKLVLVPQGPSPAPGDPDDAIAREPAGLPTEAKTYAHQDGSLSIRLEDANPRAEVSGWDELPGKRSYFIGADPRKWRANIPSYARVRYENVYPGIDLVYYGNNQLLEYDFALAPGADPSAIRLVVEGADQVTLDGQGNLLLRANGVELMQRAPLIYQEVDGLRREIPGGYLLGEKSEVGFRIGDYDPAKLLVIDPVLVFSSYIGARGQDRGLGVALDAESNVYVVGQALADAFPPASSIEDLERGGLDVFITKLNPKGELIYSVVLGGQGNDVGNDIAVDDQGNAYVTGRGDGGFPTTTDGISLGCGINWAFVAKLNPEGNALAYSTCLGPTRGSGGKAIALDGSGHALVTGGAGPGYPTTSNSFGENSRVTCLRHAFVTRLNIEGNDLDYSGCIGLVPGNGTGNGIALDGSGNAHVAGEACVEGACIAFAALVNAVGDNYVIPRVWTAPGRANAVLADSSGVTYVVGETPSCNFIPVKALQSACGRRYAGNSNQSTDAFVAKLNILKGQTLYSTYLGGDGNDVGNGIALDAAGNIYLTGSSETPPDSERPATRIDFPIENAAQSRNAGLLDAFVTKLNPSGDRVIYSTYLGGEVNDVGAGIAVDPAGNATITGFTRSAKFPVAKAFQSAKGGDHTDSDAFIARLSDNADVAIAHGALPGPVTAGRMLAFQLTVTNNGPANASNVRLTYGLPNELDLILAELSQGSCDESDSTVRCILDQLPANANATVNLLLRAGPGRPGILPSAAGVAANEPDPDTDNNRATREITVVVAQPIPTLTPLPPASTPQPTPAATLAPTPTPTPTPTSIPTQPATPTATPQAPPETPGPTATPLPTPTAPPIASGSTPAPPTATPATAAETSETPPGPASSASPAPGPTPPGPGSVGGGCSAGLGGLTGVDGGWLLLAFGWVGLLARVRNLPARRIPRRYWGRRQAL